MIKFLSLPLDVLVNWKHPVGLPQSNVKKEYHADVLLNDSPSAVEITITGGSHYLIMWGDGISSINYKEDTYNYSCVVNITSIDIRVLSIYVESDNIVPTLICKTATETIEKTMS